MKRLLTLLILLLQLPNSFSQSISSDSLVLHLPFDGNTKDISGNHYDGVVNGATLTAGENNMPNTAYYFDGKSSIVIPDIKKLDRPLKAFTILIKLMVTNLDIDPVIRPPFYTNYNFLCWHRDSPDSGSAFMASKITTGWQRDSIDTVYKPLLTYNMNWCNISQTASGYNKDFAEVLKKWHTIAYVYSDSSLKVYHNCDIMANSIGIYPGVSVLCGTEPMQISLGNVPLDVFKYGYRYFKGKIDDLQIYTRALNEQEVEVYANNLCAEKPVAHLSGSKDTCRPSVIDFTDVSDMKGFPLYSVDTLITVKSTDYIKFLFPADTSVFVCKGSSISYNVNTDAALKWDPCTFLSSCDSKAVKITPANDITYTIAGINGAGCQDSAYLKIHILLANDSVYIPNAFTPNGDRLNDTFRPLSSDRFKDIDFNIYNRFGQKIFSSDKQSNKWDGAFKGTAQPSGVYVYTLTYQQGDGCELRHEKGTVQMIR